MKRLPLLTGLALIFFNGSAQTTSSHTVPLAEPPRQNMIGVGASMDLMLTKLGLGFSDAADYLRQIDDNIYWGVSMRHSYFLHGSAHTRSKPVPGGFDFNYSIALTGMIYYELPVIHKWLSLRGGIGMGVGLHNATMRDDGINKFVVAPYFNARLQWIIHVSRTVDIGVSPLIIGPDYISWTPAVAGTLSRSTRNIVPINLMQLSVGFRF